MHLREENRIVDSHNSYRAAPGTDPACTSLMAKLCVWTSQWRGLLRFGTAVITQPCLTHGA